MVNSLDARAKRIIDSLIESSTEIGSADVECACGSDRELAVRVRELLAAIGRQDEFLSDPTVDTRAETEQRGTSIGRYKLLERLGEGGFGSVWAAEQREPVRRRVALKIIKLGMDTRQVIARFEAERQALAMMDHPNIARVLDAGSTETGRPFFVMELVKGVPILEYCDTAKLDTKSRLDLFTKVCHAIQHAHQKGIIHRDIKPSNVLITMHDGVPVPKVIDFGIAKATNAELTEQTIYTQHRQMIGTPAYMSPEQAEMSGLDIDTRSDIYSLGVLLYELLTGTTPFANQELMSKGFAEMMRIIRETEPHRPSMRLSTLGDTASKAAQQRRTDVQKLGTTLKGDLDWIVMKCLEKDRTRRYETANGLAADIQRHLHDEPVMAGPPGTGYKLRKFARKNRRALATAGVIVILLVAGVVVSTWQAIRARQAEATANANASQARINAEEAERNAQQARTEANAKTLALAAEQRAREDETMARQQAFAMLRNLAADAAAQTFPPGAVLTEDDQVFLQGVVAQAVLLARARYYITRSQWDNAAAEYAKADWSRPLADDTFAYACLFLIRGDGEGYNRFVQHIIQPAQIVGQEAYVLARTCAIARTSPVEPARAVEWANRAVASGHRPWAFHVLGLAQYRAGQFDQALQSFTEANDKAWRYANLNYFGLALVHYRLGHPDEARRCYDNGIKWLEREDPSGPEQPDKLLHQDWVEAQLLRREAEELLTIQRSP